VASVMHERQMAFGPMDRVSNPRACRKECGQVIPEHWQRPYHFHLRDRSPTTLVFSDPSVSLVKDIDFANSTVLADMQILCKSQFGLATPIPLRPEQQVACLRR
jgi:hypothetical protein